MHITKSICEAAYELLRACPPFKSWHLPSCDQVEFKIFSSDTHSAEYAIVRGKHRISINQKWCGTTGKLLSDIAHELVHMHIQLECPTERAEHGRKFWSKAKLVCKHHLYDPKVF